MTATGHAPIETLTAYRDVREATEALAAPLSAEDQVVQSMPDVSPTKWHRAHTTWFFETFVLSPTFAGYESPNPAYAYLFNSYYEQVGDRHPRSERGLISRPTVDDVGVYRRHVDDAIEAMFTSARDEVLERTESIVEVGCHHEQQHQELLLMDIKHVLSCNPLEPVYRDPDADRLFDERHPRAVSDATFLEFDGGLVDIGHGGDGFAFDNETPRHTVLLTPFRLANRLVTAGEWRAFIDDGGYERAELWLSDGWATVQSNGWDSPLYWQRDGDSWSVFTLEGRKPVVDSEPVVHVSHYEADAFAVGRCAASDRVRVGARGRVGRHRRRDDGTGITSTSAPALCTDGSPRLVQLDTDAWQWTASAYLPYPRFTPPPGALGEYNGKFMSNQMVLRGGACVTPPGHVRPTYRNFFPPTARWPFAGLRLAADA